MKYLLLLLLVSSLLNLFGQDAPKPDTNCLVLPKGISSKDYVSDIVIVKFKSINALLGRGRLNVYRALTGSSPDTRPKSTSIELEYAYPNPAHDYTNIDFSLPSTGQTSLELYSISGHLIKTMLSESLRKGHHHIVVHLDALHEGIYIYKLRQGDASRSFKLLVVK